MSLRLGDTAPNFTAETTNGKIDFHNFIGNNWCVLFSHPRDYTPVCTTELGALAKMKGEFDARGVKIIGLSVDSVEDHKGWIKDIEKTQSCKMEYPLIADEDCKVSKLYDMIHPHADETYTVRTVFVIDPDKKIRLTLTYPMATGRNFDELLRVIDSMQRTSEYKVATPANWIPGQDMIVVPSVSDAEAKKMFPDMKIITPYLRMVMDPLKGKKPNKGNKAA